MLGVLEPNDRNGHSPAGWDKNEGDNCINVRLPGALYHGPESLLTPRLREWANRTQDATGIFPVALLRFRHPGASTNTRHRIGDELKVAANPTTVVLVCFVHFSPINLQRHGVYELECRIVPRLPSTFKSSCLEIDHALHRRDSPEPRAARLQSSFEFARACWQFVRCEDWRAKYDRSTSPARPSSRAFECGT
eukprot:2905372-Prymnesium_polylepis.1